MGSSDDEFGGDYAKVYNVSSTTATAFLPDQLQPTRASYGRRKGVDRKLEPHSCGTGKHYQLPVEEGRKRGRRRGRRRTDEVEIFEESEETEGSEEWEAATTSLVETTLKFTMYLPLLPDLHNFLYTS
jgi:hypothetical protein